jgi:hypothetical protein
MLKYQDFLAIVESTKIDAEKFFMKGNNKAGVRLRKGLKEIADGAKDLRKYVSEIKHAAKGTEDTKVD